MGTPNNHFTLQPVIKRWGKMTLGPLRSPKTRDRCAGYMSSICDSMSRSKFIVPSVALAQLRHRARPTGTNHAANRSHSPLAISRRSGRLVLTRPAALAIYSASLQTSDEPNDTAAFRPEHYGSVWNKASGEGVSVGEAAADLPTDLEGRSLLVAGPYSWVDYLAPSHQLE